MYPDFGADRAAAEQWARLVLEDDKAVILDTETTGLGPRDEVIQVAVIDMCGEALFNQLLRPTIPVPPEASAIHGLDDKALADKPTFGTIRQELGAILKDRTIISYNADYDGRMLVQTARACQVRPITALWECAMQQYAAYCGYWSVHHGNYRYQKLPRLPGVHDALADCQATLEVIRKMAGVER